MFEGRDELTVIQEDIKRAYGKPGTKWAMLIDLRRCTACKACTVGCMVEQKSPPGVMYRPIYLEETGTFPKVKRRFTPRPCLQCDDPPCVEACPNKGEGKATWKSTKGDSAGIVMINYEQCIGCGRCVAGCPYKARTLDRGAFHTGGTPKIEGYDESPSWEYSRKWPREKDQLPVGVARKCHFCLHRLRKGMVPVCVNTCVCRANYFGDPEDKESLIHKVMMKNKIKVLSGVTPNVDAKVGTGMFKNKSAEEIAKKVGYPGMAPVFADSAVTKPRVYYILPV
ncbi:MAG: 4Fe-4S dicluster domain-containing protein [Nitrospiraceae bacterium]|nr:MAG: 4Fe-4S dicluster domain-containing protein [Nitrospiraceae bacterium]